MKLLLDAHTLLWAIYEPERLPPRAAEDIAELDNDLFLSFATFLEVINKAAVFRLPLAGSSVEKVAERIDELGVTYLPITRPDILAAAKLDHHHEDPFDRILIAQARENSLTLVTKDEQDRKIPRVDHVEVIEQLLPASNNPWPRPPQRRRTSSSGPPRIQITRTPIRIQTRIRATQPRPLHPPIPPPLSTLKALPTPPPRSAASCSSSCWPSSLAPSLSSSSSIPGHPASA